MRTFQNLSSLLVFTLLAAACGAPEELGEEELGTIESPLTVLDASVCLPQNGPLSPNLTNSFMPYQPGHRVRLSNRSRDTILFVTGLNETESVMGIQTRVVEERSIENGRLHEVARNFFAQASDGTVCFFGEDVQYFNRRGEVISTEGSWRAGEGGAGPGIMMPGAPAVGMDYPQEVAPGIAEDRSTIVALNRKVVTAEGTYRRTVVTRDYNPLDPEDISSKTYAHGVGLVKDDDLRLRDLDLPGDDD